MPPAMNSLLSVKPPFEMTGTSLPSRVNVSPRWFEFGPVLATCVAYGPASRQRTTMRTKTTRALSATQLRRNRRQASTHGLLPSISPCSSAASAAAESSVKSVDDSVATTPSFPQRPGVEQEGEPRRTAPSLLQTCLL